MDSDVGPSFGGAGILPGRERRARCPLHQGIALIGHYSWQSLYIFMNTKWSKFYIRSKIAHPIHPGKRSGKAVVSHPVVRKAYHKS